MSNIQNESSGQTSAQIYITSKSNYKRVISKHIDVDNIVKSVVAFVNVNTLVSESYEVIIPFVVSTLDELNKFTKSVTL